MKALDRLWKAHAWLSQKGHKAYRFMTPEERQAKDAVIEDCRKAIRDLGQLLHSVGCIVPDLEHYVSKQGTGPDGRLANLKLSLAQAKGETLKVIPLKGEA